jgi:hypothetical protein
VLLPEVGEQQLGHPDPPEHTTVLSAVKDLLQQEHTSAIRESSASINCVC